jgi:hypothetical protein
MAAIDEFDPSERCLKSASVLGQEGGSRLLERFRLRSESCGRFGGFAQRGKVFVLGSHDLPL